MQAAWKYLNPAVAASSVLFEQINHNTKSFTDFLVKTGHLMSDIASRQSDLTGLVQHLSTTTGALANQHRKLSHTTGDRAAAEQVASRMASALVNFDYTNLNGSKNRVLDLATGKFKNEYDQAFKGGLDVLLTQTKAKSTGVVKNVFLDGPADLVVEIVSRDTRARG